MQKWPGKNLNTADYWDKTGQEEYDRGEYREFHYKFDKILKHLGPGKILDVGCGTGALCRRLSSSFDGKAEITGIDFSPAQIEICKKLSEERSDLYPRETYLVSEVYSLPFETETFDYVISSEVFEHLSDLQQAANEVVRVCKKGGKVILTTPLRDDIDQDEAMDGNREHIWSMEERMFIELFLGHEVAFDYFRSNIVAIITKS